MGARDVERIKFVTQALEQSKMDAMVCALPSNVLMLSGYWPVLGTAIAIVSRTGHVHVLTPDDEEDLARSSWADVVETFSLGSLDELKTVVEMLRAPLRATLTTIGSQHDMIVGC